MAEAERISVEEVHKKKEAGENTLLVCAYQDDEKFHDNHLEGAISLKALEHRLDAIPKDQEIIFYCAWPNDETAAGRAAEYQEKGYENAKILDGGVQAWEDAGYPVESPT